MRRKGKSRRTARPKAAIAHVHPLPMLRREVGVGRDSEQRGAVVRGGGEAQRPIFKGKRGLIVAKLPEEGKNVARRRQQRPAGGERALSNGCEASSAECSGIGKECRHVATSGARVAFPSGRHNLQRWVRRRRQRASSGAVVRAAPSRPMMAIVRLSHGG